MTYVEELARAFVGEAWGELTLQQRQAFVSNADAWIDAIAALAERGGPKLVRREPTEEMRVAGLVRWREGYTGIPAMFSRMFDAAPAVPEETVAGA